MTSFDQIAIAKPETVIEVFKTYRNQPIGDVEPDVQIRRLISEVDRLKSDFTNLELDIHRVADTTKIRQSELR
jgi:hypothetical protein